MTYKFIATSGVEVTINPAPFRDAKELKKAIERTAYSLPNIADIETSPEQMIRLILLLDSSDEIDAALWPCLARCLRGANKITEITFDDLEARKDYYDIIVECAKLNIGPLVASLFSKYYALGVKKKQEATPTPK